MLTLDITRETSEQSPNEDTLQRAAALAVQLGLPEPERGVATERELSLRIVDCDEMRDLNRRYRGKDRPTNVLSFPADLPDVVNLPLLGDIAICAPVVRREALEQGKPLAAHWDHMLIHGVLHLLGFDHESDAEAAVMEALETQALQQLGWPCPYSATPAQTAAEMQA